MNNSTTLCEPLMMWAAADGATCSNASSQFDYAIARRISGGDMEAFEELYLRHHRTVYSLCHRMTGNPTEAEDLAQEVFIHVYHKIGSFRGEASMKTWLHRVTVNKVLMHFRKSAVKRERMTEDGETPEPAPDVAQVTSYAFAVDRIALDRAIEELPPGYRAVFTLHDVEGYEHAEVAQILGISIGTSKSQLHKARMRLRRLLKRRKQRLDASLY